MDLTQANWVDTKVQIDRRFERYEDNFSCNPGPFRSNKLLDMTLHFEDPKTEDEYRFHIDNGRHLKYYAYKDTPDGTRIYSRTFEADTFDVTLEEIDKIIDQLLSEEIDMSEIAE